MKQKHLVSAQGIFGVIYGARMERFYGIRYAVAQLLDDSEIALEEENVEVVEFGDERDFY